MVVDAMSQDQVKCVMCGKTILENKVLYETVDDGKYTFDSQDCILFFKKFKSLYGDSLKV